MTAHTCRRRRAVEATQGTATLPTLLDAAAAAAAVVVYTSHLLGTETVANAELQDSRPAVAAGLWRTVFVLAVVDEDEAVYRYTVSGRVLREQAETEAGRLLRRDQAA
jgi:hypothetical protein